MKRFLSIKVHLFFLLKGVLSGFITLLFVSNNSIAQTLSVNEFMQIVREHHPIVQKANLSIERSEAELLNAKSGFEPVLSTSYADKRLGGIDYYNQLYPQVSIPTWFGIDVSAGLTNLSGQNVDPTMTYGQSSFVGVSIPLLKNLIIDKRRATLQQSKLFLNMSENERDIILNDLLKDALDAYWEWVKAYELQKVVQSMLDLNYTKMDFVRRSFFNGEKAAIDTLESYTQLLFFKSKQLEANNKLVKSKLFLSLFCWKDGQPVEIGEAVIPSEDWKETTYKDDAFLLSKIDSISISHPIMKSYALKTDVLDIDKRLKFQQLLPKLDVYYNYLGKNYDFWYTLQSHQYFQDNYQYGLKFELPLLLMKGRADYKIAKIKLEQNAIDLSYKNQELKTKLKALYNQYETQRQQLVIQKSIYENYQYLVKVEQMKLENGESALFFVNSRENKAMESLEKWVEIQVKFHQTRYAILWTAGELR